MVTRTSALLAALAVPLLVPNLALAQAQPAQPGGYVQVSPGAQATTGEVVVHAPVSGEVITQNLSIPNPPREHRGRITGGGSVSLKLAPGQWNVGVDFDDGSSDSREVRVDPAFRAEVTLQTWTLARSGAHFGFMVYGTGTYGFDSGEFFGGPLARGFVNFGGTGTVDFQLGGQIGARFNSGPSAGSLTDPVVEVSLVADAVWAARGGIWRPYVGGRVGGWFGDFRRCGDIDCASVNEGAAEPVFAVEGSLLHFTFGSRRNFDVDLGQDLSFMLDTIGEQSATIFFGINLGVGAVFY
ncbi:MAG: hypothetical protein U0414_33920 [Polyangiaceae bacterium]